MRSDMAKVIVERPRSGSGRANWTTRRDRIRQRDGQWDQLPKQRPMRPRDGNQKWLNENLRPLIRFLRSRLNRPWDNIYSELRAQMDVRSATQKHIFEHLEDFVAIHARWQDGVLYDTSCYGGWRRLRRTGRQFYVDPRSGLLKEPPDLRWVPVPDAPHRQLLAGKLYVRFRTIWYAVRLERLPRRWGWAGEVRYDGAPRFDALLKTHARAENEDERFDLYGKPELIAVWKAPLNRKTLKQLGLWRR